MRFSKTRLDRMHSVMAGFVERGELPGLVTLVSRGDEVHVDAIGMKTRGGSDPMLRDTLFRIASMSKPVTAAAAMILVEECRLRLDDPVDPFLPELADRKVLKRPDGPLDDTVPAKRPISLRDLLTLRLGLGHIMDPAAGEWPIRKALTEQQLLLGPPKPRDLPSTDEWIRRVGTLPLMYQPGERWMYDLGIDILGVLIERAAGQPFETFLKERLFNPLGMKDTGFSVPEGKLDRLPGCYQGDQVYDDPRDSQWSRPPAFASGSGGLVSTADDYLAFCRMMLNKGRHGSERILSRPSVEVMTTDQLTPEQMVGADLFFGGNSGWGFGMAVYTRRNDLSAVPGRFGWTGGLGTAGYTDPREDLIGILMTQLLMDSPQAPHIFEDFWTSAYQAIDD